MLRPNLSCLIEMIWVAGFWILRNQMRPRAQVHVSLCTQIGFDLGTLWSSEMAHGTADFALALQFLELHFHLPIFFHHILDILICHGYRLESLVFLF